ncbi:MAG: hypothetical protein J5J00_06820 [Deltaproteobacteria bacterium]|nr:hypothetical protein [Deltaproteobacteria bacterium]
MKSLAFITFLALCLPFLLSSCQREQAESALDGVGDKLNQGYQYARDSAKEIPGKAEELSESAAREVSKLHSLEYKVFELDKSTDSFEIERKLATLGLERWDCFFVRERFDSLQFFCKRHPKTLLRYLPRVF